MTRLKLSLLLALAASALAVPAGMSTRAQDRGDGKSAADARGKSALSVQDALNRPFPFTFDKPTPLEEVSKQLSRALNAPVAIDRSALDRLGLKINDEVQLRLDGVRLKTGLKLLLDQLDLTYKVVPEDNLLVITDEAGSSDPAERVLAEVQSLHRELHAVQDALSDLRADLGLDDAGGAKVRKPTIIEEMPADAGGPKKPAKEPPPASAHPRSRPGL